MTVTPVRVPHTNPYAHCITAKVNGVTLQANYLLDIIGAAVSRNRAQLGSTSAPGRRDRFLCTASGLRRNAEFRYDDI
jgi:hypothetical protein